MANPYTLGSRTALSKGPGESQDNFTALGDGEAKIIGVVDLSSGAPFADFILEPMKLITDAAGWATGDTMELLLLQAEDTGADFTDGVDETSNADISSSLVEAISLGAILTEANSTTYYFDEIKLSNFIGFNMPSHIAIVLRNNAAGAGADLSATAGDHFARYRTYAYA